MSDIQNEINQKPEARLNLQGESEMILREAVAFALAEALESDEDGILRYWVRGGLLTLFYVVFS